MISRETKGAVFALASAALWGIFPVMVHHGTKTIPPLMFAAITMLLAAVASFLYAAYKKNLGRIADRKAFFPIIMVTLCVVVIPSVLFYTGSSMTSGMNTSSLLLAEVIFTLMFTPLIGEKNTTQKYVGAIGILVGAALILYNGTLSLNWGDLLIIASTLTYPIGNFYAKKALNLVPPAVVLVIRFTLGGLFLLVLSALFEPLASLPSIVASSWWVILLTGFLLMGVTKMIWYEGLRRLDISKAISLGMTFPLFSLALLLLVFREPISLFQWLGIGVMMVGVYYSLRRASVDPALTRYAPEH
ncbi:MAG: DMT family transporter [archaeon]